MNITIKASKSFTTSDNLIFTERAHAVAHEKKLARAVQLASVSFSDDSRVMENDGGHQIIYMSDLPAFLAHNAEAIIEALSVRESRGRKAKSVTTAAA